MVRRWFGWFVGGLAGLWRLSSFTSSDTMSTSLLFGKLGI